MAAVGANLYPWDVVGDPRAADWVAALGVDQVTLAAAYHATRALTPRHPDHRVVLARHAAVYYPPGQERWGGRRLRPAAADWVAGPDSFGVAAQRLREAGLRVNAWAVLTHNSHLGERYQDVAVVNAYGDRYPWALCPAHDEVRDYVTTLAAEVAALDDLDGLELESCGWYGFGHLSGHDKTGGVQLSEDQHYLFSLCFCAACRAAYAAGGIDAGQLRGRVRAALDPVFAGGVPGELDGELAEPVLAVRSAIADRLRAETIAAVREVSPGLPIILHADPDPRRCGACTGCDPAAGLAAADGLLLSCWGPRAQAVAAIAEVASAAPAGRRIVASLLTVAGLGGRPAELPELALAVLGAGANELRLYHAGLASAADLETMRSVTAAAR